MTTRAAAEGAGPGDPDDWDEDPDPAAMTTGLREIERRRDSAEASYRSDHNPEDHDYWLGRKEAFDEALALATPNEPGLDVERLKLAMHAQAVGCYELAHWETTGEGDPDDHLIDAQQVAAEYARLREDVPGDEGCPDDEEGRLANIRQASTGGPDFT